MNIIRIEALLSREGVKEFVGEMSSPTTKDAPLRATFNGRLTSPRVNVIVAEYVRVRAGSGRSQALSATKLIVYSPGRITGGVSDDRVMLDLAPGAKFHGSTKLVA